MKRVTSPKANSSKRPKKSQEPQKVPTIDSVHEALDFLESATKTRSLPVQLSVNLIQRTARSEGLPGDILIKLIAVIGRKKFSEAVCRRLIRSLLPFDVVPVIAVLKTISWMGVGNISIALQADLMRWIVAVYDHIDKKDDLHSIYGIIFHYIECDIIFGGCYDCWDTKDADASLTIFRQIYLSPFACHLLYLLTRKEDVLPFRVRRVIALQSKVGAQPYLTGLLTLYKTYRPDLVTVQPKQKQKFFRSLGGWDSLIKEVKSRTLHILTPSVPEIQYTMVHQEEDFVRPEIQYQSVLGKSGIKTFQELQSLLENLKPPNGILSVLRSPVRRIILSSCTDRTLLVRMKFLLRVLLFDEPFHFAEGKKRRGRHILRTLTDVTEELQEGIPEVESFLIHYLQVWNGLQWRSSVLTLISRWPLRPFVELKEFVLKPLHKLLCSSSLEFQCSILECLTQLCKNWAVVELPRYKQTKMRQEINVNDSVPVISSVFDQEVEELDAEECLMELAAYIGHICITALMLNPTSPPLLIYHILRFYHMTVDFYYTHDTTLLALPSAPVVYSCLFSTNVFCLSEICRLITRYRGMIQLLKQRIGVQLQRHIDELNNYILDISNTIWLNKAFKPESESVLFKVPIPVSISHSIDNPSETFLLLYHPALTAMTQNFLKKAGDRVQHPHQVISDRAVRNAYLQYLSSHYMSGITGFLQTFIKMS
ncbi:centromere protein I-like isoform X2 [Tachypleus tridentatus]|uniref:centromere protein I-like isoform X2 n=1 Tax=Tachypleus tridentatus TaxID=6853 RepID=UPI003FCEE691